jgi:hypothetical protein
MLASPGRSVVHWRIVSAGAAYSIARKIGGQSMGLLRLRSSIWQLSISVECAAKLIQAGRVRSQPHRVLGRKAVVNFVRSLVGVRGVIQNVGFPPYFSGFGA